MESKNKFSSFITEKRKEAGLTQEELAQRLFVSNTAVSKWERGVSYPDITLISSICKELNITEHEFVTATNDMERKREQKDAKKYRIVSRTTELIFLISYGIAILSCFIVNLAVTHNLTWFFVVLASILLAFSITNLPFILNKTGLIKDKRMTILICSLAVVVLIYLVIIATYKFSYYGSWKLGPALLAATVSVIIPILMILTGLYLKKNWYIKSAVMVILAAIICFFNNPVLSRILDYERISFLDVINPFKFNSNTFANAITGYSLLICGIVLFIIGKKAENK